MRSVYSILLPIALGGVRIILRKRAVSVIALPREKEHSIPVFVRDEK